MTRTKVKLVPVMNESSRALTLKRRSLGLFKMVRELTILCDVKACMIIFNPKETEPMVWPSLEVSRNLLDDFFALHDTEKKKKETSLDSYLTEKIKKAHEQLKKIHNKNMEHVVDQLMMQLYHGRGFADLNLNEIYTILSFSKDKIMHFRKKFGFFQYVPLRDPPMYLFEAQSEELRTTRNEIDEASRRFGFGSLRENQSHYLMDRWVFASSEPVQPRINHENPNFGSQFFYQGSNSNGNSNSEMEFVGSQVMTFQNLLGLVSQPLQYHYMNNNSIMNLSQPRINNNVLVTNDGVNQDPSPYGRMAEEGNVDVISFDINQVWPRINHHF